MDAKLESLHNAMNAILECAKKVQKEKEAGKEPSKELVSDAIAASGALKASSRDLLLSVDAQERATAVARETADASELRRANFAYEAEHLQREIRDARGFVASNAAAVDLVEEDEFFSSGSAIAEAVDRSDVRALALARLEHELELRGSLGEEVAAREKRLRAAEAEITRMREELEGLPDLVRPLLTASSDARAFVGATSSRERVIGLARSNLGRHLYALARAWSAAGAGAPEGVTCFAEPLVEGAGRKRSRKKSEVAEGGGGSDGVVLVLEGKGERWEGEVRAIAKLDSESGLVVVGVDRARVRVERDEEDGEVAGSPMEATWESVEGYLGGAGILGELIAGDDGRFTPVRGSLASRRRWETDANYRPYLWAQWLSGNAAPVPHDARTATGDLTASVVVAQLVSRLEAAAAHIQHHLQPASDPKPLETALRRRYPSLVPPSFSSSPIQHTSNTGDYPESDDENPSTSASNTQNTADPTLPTLPPIPHTFLVHHNIAIALPPAFPTHLPRVIVLQDSPLARQAEDAAATAAANASRNQQSHLSAIAALQAAQTTLKK